jgi:urease accessory protein
MALAARGPGGASPVASTLHEIPRDNDLAMTLHNAHLATRTAEPLPGTPPMQRARGEVRLRLVAGERGTHAFEAYQEGSATVRFPRVEAGQPFEVTLINTAGGITGGDHFGWTIAAEAGAHAAVTGQAAERIYKRSAGVARIETTLSVGDGASLAWLPQETIVFDRSALKRTLMADVHPNGRLLAAEAIVLGRAAMGEAARAVTLSDTWRVRFGGKLVFADGLRLDGDTTATLASGAMGRGATAMATLVLVAPDAGEQIEVARAAAAEAAGEAGVSAWNGILVARLIATDGQTLRADLIRLIMALRRANMPRVWHC